MATKAPNRRLEERRAQFKRYKDDVNREGKPFFPYAVFHDIVMGTITVLVIIGLACVWYFTSGEDPEDVGWLGPRYTEEADPGTTNFIPRPDWFFYFLFYLLRIFKWPETVVLGTVGIPTVLMILLFALPFVDLRKERRILRRPVALVAAVLVVISMGVLTYKGATAEESLGTALVEKVPEWAEIQGFAGNEDAEAGAVLFAQSGCMNCHIYLGDGSPNLGAPDLTDAGSKGKGVEWQVEHLKCPSCVTPGSPMPAFANLGDENLRQIAVFLEASKGPQE